MKTRRLLNPFFLISIQNARLQILRVAKERGLTEAVASAEVDKATERPFLGIGGGPGGREARGRRLLLPIQPDLRKHAMALASSASCNNGDVRPSRAAADRR